MVWYGMVWYILRYLTTCVCTMDMKWMLVFQVSTYESNNVFSIGLI
jgi:hypothetical protein